MWQSKTLTKCGICLVICIWMGMEAVICMSLIFSILWTMIPEDPQPPKQQTSSSFSNPQPPKQQTSPSFIDPNLRTRTRTAPVIVPSLSTFAQLPPPRPYVKGLL